MADGGARPDDVTPRFDKIRVVPGTHIPLRLGDAKTEEVDSLSKKKQIGILSAIGLVLLTVSACAPSAGPYNQRNYSTLGYKDGAQTSRVNNLYNSPAGPYDDDPGYKNDFQRSDLNPNMVTGKNDLFNVTRDANTLRQIALSVRGVDSAEVRLHGGTAHVSIHVDRPTVRDVQKVKSRVYHQMKMKMPQYKLDIVAR
jgi:hypothetical protein